MSKNPIDLELRPQVLDGLGLRTRDSNEEDRLAHKALAKLRQIDPELAALYEHDKSERRRRPRSNSTEQDAPA